MVKISKRVNIQKCFGLSYYALKSLYIEISYFISEVSKHVNIHIYFDTVSIFCAFVLVRGNAGYHTLNYHAVLVQV